MNILFVCLGNICRSPVAAGIMKRIYEENGITGVIESAGTADWNVGGRADARTVQVALERGIDLRGHRARQIHLGDFDRFDLIVVMDQSNYNAVSKLAPEEMRGKVRRLLEYLQDHNGDVPDPYHGGETGFQSNFDVIHKGCSALAEELFGIQTR